MKLLKYAGIFLLALILTLGGAVYFAPGEVEYDTSVTINAPLSETWAVFEDQSQMPKWFTSLKEVKQILTTKGVVGSQSEFIFETDGQEMIMTETVTHYIPRERYSFDAEIKDQMTIHSDVFFEAIDSNTTVVKSVNSAQTHSAIMDLFTWSNSGFQKNAQTTYESFKALVEN